MRPILGRLHQRFLKSSIMVLSLFYCGICVRESLFSDPIFLILYNELYYRHLFSKTKPTLQQRFDSWDNYVQLFSLISKKKDIVAPETPSESQIDLALLELPVSWVWDIVDEFIYQFQSFCQYRATAKDGSSFFLLLENGNVSETVPVRTGNYRRRARMLGTFLECSGCSTRQSSRLGSKLSLTKSAPLAIFLNDSFSFFSHQLHLQAN